MEKFSVGDIVLVCFPFSDLSQQKLRPALVLADVKRGDYILCQITSRPYHKRFKDIFDPAINDAGLEPYRVDQDPLVEVPIESIEKGIRDAAICLADMTTDNPNVWYELGYAFAAGKSVVMVCSDERKESRFPFDIQH